MNSSRIARALRDSLVFLFFLALAVALTWPLATELPYVLADLGDSALNTWILDWDCFALTHRPLHLYDAPIFVPDKFPLAYSENLIGTALVMLPFHFAGATPAALHNLATILAFATSAFGAFVLARMVTGSMAGAIVAGIFFGFTSWKFDHIVQIQMIWTAWVPLMLAALVRFWRRGDRRSAALFGAAFAMNGLSCVYWLDMGGFAIAASIVFLAITEPRRERAFWTRLAAALVIACAVLIPFLVPYKIVAKKYGMKRWPGEIASASAIPSDWLLATEHNLLYGTRRSDSPRPERRLFPGALVLILTASAAALARRARREPAKAGPPSERTKLLRTLDVLAAAGAAIAVGGAVVGKVDITIRSVHILSYEGPAIPLMATILAILARLFLRYPGSSGRSLRDTIAASRFTPYEWIGVLWIAIGFVGSLGVNGPLHPFLYRVVPIFGAMRVVARWALVAYAGLAIWTAIGVREILGRTSLRRTAAFAMCAFALAEVLVAPIDWHRVPRVTPVYRWLAAERPGTALELPVSGGGEQALYLLASTYHHQPIMNGASGWDGPTHNVLREKYERGEMDDDFLARIERAGCRILIVHRRMLGERQPKVDAWLQRGIERGRMVPLRSFGDDQVLAVK